MTDDTTTSPVPQGGRIEPVDLQVEMQRSYLDYAMSVIVSRALPDVRDGLKPVHRKILYAMFDGGYRPDRGFSKCSRVVGDVMGNYHPHGDTAIYDTLVRLGQWWSMRYRLVQGQGNFGSRGDDRQAAMRYCLSGDTRVRTADGTVPIADIVPDAEPNSDHDIDLKLFGRSGELVRATKFFHSGSHQTLRVRTANGIELTGTYNHPVLCLVPVAGMPTLLWKLLEEIQPGDIVVASRPAIAELPDAPNSAWLAHVPFLADFVRRPESARNSVDHTWLKLHNVDRIDRWERRGAEIADRLTDEAFAVVEPLVDGRFYYAEVASVEAAGVQPVYSVRVDTDDHAFITNGLVSHNTECRMAPLAMEMVRDIEEDAVDFMPNYDGRSDEPVVLPSRFPNLLVNGAGGIAVGMATNIPPHNLREVAACVDWYLDNPEASNEELLNALLERIKGPDFPTSGLIVGTTGIEQAYRTGRGSVTMRAVVDVEEDQKGRTCLVVTELPYQVNPDSLTRKIAELADTGKVPGIADLRDDSSARTGMRIVIVLKRDAVATVVRNNLYKHTQLQDTFGCNMVALVDGVPRTLSLDAFVRHWVGHQIDVIRRRTAFRLRKRRERLHIVRALIKAIDVIDEVIALIRQSPSAADAQVRLQDFLEIDELQARAILDMQLRKLAALERQELQDEHDTLVAAIAELEKILASDERKRQIIREELSEIVEKYGDERRSRIVPAEGDLTAEDLIPEEPVVVTITRGGYAKRTKVDLYRSQRRGGKGVRGAQLREDDVVAQFFVTTTHHWILFFTNRGRVYRAKAYELPELARDSKGQHVANLLAFQPDEKIAQVLAIRDYEQAPYLVLATKNGMVKKTRLTEYDSPRSGGLIAVTFRHEDDELIGAELVSANDDILLVSRKAQAIRFTATDEQLRPMGRATGGVVGMKFRDGDELLSMSVVHDGTDSFVFTVTNGGYAKRTVVEDYRVQGRGGLGIKAMKINEERGTLVGALVVGEGDEVLAIRASGGVTRSPVRDVPAKGRDTMGVKYVSLGSGDAVVAIAWNAEDETATESVPLEPTVESKGEI